MKEVLIAILCALIVANSECKPSTPDVDKSFEFNKENVPGVDRQHVHGSPDSRTFDSRTSDSRTSDSGTSDSQTSDSQMSDSRISDPRTSDPRTSDSRTSDSRTSDSRTSDSRTSDSRTSDSRTSDFQTSDSRTSEPRTSDSQMSDFENQRSISVDQRIPTTKAVVDITATKNRRRRSKLEDMEAAEDIVFLPKFRKIQRYYEAKGKFKRSIDEEGSLPSGETMNDNYKYVPMSVVYVPFYRIRKYTIDIKKG